MTILVVLIYPTVTIPLPFYLAVISKGLVNEPAVVSVIAKDLHPLVSCPPFVCVLGFYRLFAGDLFHVVYLALLKRSLNMVAALYLLLSVDP